MSTPTPRTDAAEKLARETYERLREAGDPNFDISPYVLAYELETELASLRADLERFTGGGLLDCHSVCDQRDAAVARAERAEAEILDRAAMMRDVMRERDKAEAECLEQARLLGMSGEREADLLGKLERAEKLNKLWREFITLMEITEESNSGNKFNPNKISSCRALDGRKLNEILVEARKIVF